MQAADAVYLPVSWGNAEEAAELPGAKPIRRRNLMNFHPLHHSRLLAMDPDPILCAGVVAATRCGTLGYPDWGGLFSPSA